MKGKVSLTVKNRHITFKLDLERNITIITGDSGTGKTKLINMVRMFSWEGKASGVTLKCDYPCIVLEGNRWETILESTHKSIVFVEESTSFLTSHEFAKAIQNTDNYYVFVTRESLSQIPYSVDSIKQIVKNESKPKIERIYKKISVKNIAEFPYESVIVEDSKAGFIFFTKATEKWNISCISAGGKSNMLTALKKSRSKKILLIADAAALGSEIKEIINYKNIGEKNIDLFLPESFEWLILKSDIFNSDPSVKEILQNPVDHIESAEFISWERFFTYLLSEITKDKPKLKYPKDKSKLPSGYLIDANIDSIINAMNNK